MKPIMESLESSELNLNENSKICRYRISSSNFYVYLSYVDFLLPIFSIQVEVTVRHSTRVIVQQRFLPVKRDPSILLGSFEGDDDSFLFFMCVQRGRNHHRSLLSITNSHLTTLTQIQYTSINQNEVRRCRHPCSCLFGFGLCPCSFCQRKFVEEGSS